tara:strand:+ start:21345 stop:21482 length:138 start_codon:yes stop_codon:yes gene_type:complete
MYNLPVLLTIKVKSPLKVSGFVCAKYIILVTLFIIGTVEANVLPP